MPRSPSFIVVAADVEPEAAGKRQYAAQGVPVELGGVLGGVGCDPAVPVGLVPGADEFPQPVGDGFQDGQEPAQLLVEFNAGLDVRGRSQRPQGMVCGRGRARAYRRTRLEGAGRRYAEPPSHLCGGQVGIAPQAEGRTGLHAGQNVPKLGAAPDLAEDMRTDDGWAERLGWAFDLISESLSDRRRAHARLLETQRRRSEALRHHNEIWGQYENPEWHVRANLYHEARAHTLPDALWEGITWDELAGWGGLPYALLYLKWESRYPDEWFTYGKSWGTKHWLLNDFAKAAHLLPAEVTRLLTDLILHAVHREHRCEDVGYARLARTLDGPELRERLAGPAADPDDTYRRRAQYLLWLLDHPEAPRPRKRQWLIWLASQPR